ncbi:MAG: hypothetical protein WC083_04180 [Candidatus Methanomethylophilaceae archaeon]
MIRNTVPVFELHQVFTRTPSELTSNLRAMVVGPHFHLCRYDDAGEKATGLLGNYDPSLDTFHEWPGKPAGAVVDQSYTKVHVDNALLKYFEDMSDEGSLIAPVTGFDNRLTCANLVWKTANGVNRSAEFNDRDVAIGDVVWLAGKDGTGNVHELWTEIAGFGYDRLPSVIGATADADAHNQQTTDGASSVGDKVGMNEVTITPSHASFDALAYGRSEEAYTFICTKAMVGTDISTARFRVVSASGSDDVAQIQFETSGEQVVFGKFGASLALTVTGTSTIAINDQVVVNFSQTYEQPVVTGHGTFVAASDKTYIIRVLAILPGKTAAVITATAADNSDSSGPHTVAIDSEHVIGNFGARIKFATVPCPGDVYTLECTAAANGAANTLILRRALPAAIRGENHPVEVSLKLFVKSNIVLGASDYEQDNSYLKINGEISAYEPSWTSGGIPLPLPVEGGEVYINYRAMMVSYAMGRSEFATAEAALAALGPAVADNPLSLAVYKALQNSQGVPVGCIAVSSDDVEGYSAALTKIQDLSVSYSIVPLTQDPAIQDLVTAHVYAQSDPLRGRYRLVWQNSECPVNDAVATQTSSGGTLMATIHAYPDGSSSYRKVIADDAQFITDGVVPGDILRINYVADNNYSTYVVDQVVSEDMLILTSGPSAPINTPMKAEVWHTKSSQEQAENYASKSRRFSNMRVRHIYPDIVELSDGTPVKGFYLCAGLAGLKSALAPHQPLTRVALVGFGSTRRSTVDMQEQHLDIMARDGTWVVTQDDDGAIYTRMAVTTDTSDISVSQDIRVSNADSLSFAFNNRFKGMMGSTVINDRLLSAIRNEIRSTADYFASSTATPNLGPQLVPGPDGDLCRIVSGPEQDLILKDEVAVAVELWMPFGLGRLKMTLQLS